MIVRCCEDCAEKLGRVYAADKIQAVGVAGSCPICFRQAKVFGWEMTKPEPRYRRRSGGGERARASGR